MKRTVRPLPTIPTLPLQRNAAGTSMLYAVEPRGLGTPFVEGLPSYIRWLAELHVKRHWLLLTRLILDPHRLAHPHDQGMRFPISNLPEGVSGGLHIGAVIVGHLEALTGVPTVRRTTFFNRTEDLWFRKSMRQFRAWCPDCLRADKDQPYDRLLWSLYAYTVCVTHERRLIDACPHCGQRRRPLRNDVRPTVCGACQGSLVDGPTGRVEVDAISRAAHDFVARLETGGSITRAEIDAGVTALVHASGGTWKSVGDTIGGGGAIFRIVRGRCTRVDFDTLVKCVAQSGEDLETFLRHELKPLQRYRPLGYVPKPRAADVARRAKAIAALRSVLADPAAAPTIRGFVREHQVSDAWMREVAPELVAELVERGRRGRSQRRSARIATARADIERDVRALHARFGRLSWTIVNDHLAEPGRLRNKALHALADDLINTLTHKEAA